MDPKEQIRRFLEQRRELGEREFVLDSLDVDDVLRVLGAREGAAASEPGARPRTRDDPTGGEDWRTTLSALGSEQATASAEQQPGEGRGARGTASVPASDTSGERRTVVPEGVGSPPRSQNRDVAPERRNPSVPGRTISSPQAMPPSDPTSSHEPGGSPATIPLDQVPAGLVVGSSAPDILGAPAATWSSLEHIASAVASCRNCSLYETAKNPVPGAGSPHAELVCVGEAPGASEDEQGVPFVGQAGQLLTKILAAINLSRDDVFICNVLKHRPPGNRNPLPEEVAACSPYLVRQIQLLRPKVILALGTFGAQTLLQTREPLGKLRGKIHHYNGVPLVVTYHPAALLRNPAWKRPTWEDVQLARKLLDRAISGA